MLNTILSLPLKCRIQIGIKVPISKSFKMKILKNKKIQKLQILYPFMLAKIIN